MELYNAYLRTLSREKLNVRPVSLLEQMGVSEPLEAILKSMAPPLSKGLDFLDNDNGPDYDFMESEAYESSLMKRNIYGFENFERLVLIKEIPKGYLVANFEPLVFGSKEYELDFGYIAVTENVLVHPILHIKDISDSVKTSTCVQFTKITKGWAESLGRITQGFMEAIEFNAVYRLTISNDPMYDVDLNDAEDRIN